MRKWISRSLVWSILSSLIILTFIFPESKYIQNAGIFLGFVVLFMNALFIIILASFRSKNGKPVHTGAPVVACAVSLVRSKNEHNDFSIGVFLLLVIALSVSGHFFVGFGLLILKFLSAASEIAAVDYMEAFKSEDVF